MVKWQIFTTDDVMVKINVETGETWVLEETSGKMAWRLIEDEQQAV